jgi:phosphoglycerate dehydrogenase-like enzyme
MKNVFYLSYAPDDVYAIIRAQATPGFRLVTLEHDSMPERLEKIATAEVVIVAATPLRKPLLDAATKLEVIHHQGVGWQDTTDHEIIKARGIPLALTPEGTTTGVAEHAVLMILAALKMLPFADSELRAGRFHVNALRPRSRELNGLTIGYVGMGRIGQALAQRLAPFNVRGLYHDPAVPAFGNLESATLTRVIAEADILTLHVPLTAETRHLIGEKQLAMMKRGSYLVNVSRGGIVDEAALAAALTAGHLAGAALDVFESEPVKSGHPLAAFDNVVLTPHIAAGTRDALSTKMRALFANLERFYRGEPLNNRVI